MDNETPRTPSSAEARFNKHLELAAAHVSDAWLPVTSLALERVNAGIRDQRYNDEVGPLVEDIRRDLGLYAYCLKKLGPEVTQRLGRELEPGQILLEAGYRRLSEVVSGSPSDFSLHIIEESNQYQATQMQTALVSATVTETLAPKFSVDPEVGYSTALLRQLGLALIAWNYPHVYKRAVASARPDAPFEEAITKVLGFSPTMLAVKLSRDWGLCASVRSSIGDRAAEGTVDEATKQATETITKLCNIGEAFARASNPEHYPTALHDWDEARAFIAERLGPSGLDQIQTRLKENLEFYTLSLPDLFKVPQRAKNNAGLEKVVSPGLALLEKNAYTKHCPSEVAKGLTELYTLVEPDQVSREALDRLLKHLMPAAGFIRGCVYLVDPDSTTLQPRLGIGATKATSYTPVNYLSGALSQNPVAGAFRSATPTMQSGINARGETVTFISGAIGSQQRVGVLYLEVSERLSQSSFASPVMIFKALRQALNDCLGM